LDELLNYLMKEATVDSFSESETKRVLERHGFAIIKLSCNDERSYDKIAKEINSKILALSGQEVGSGHIKFAGHWLNADLSSGAVIYYYMLKVI